MIRIVAGPVRAAELSLPGADDENAHERPREHVSDFCLHLGVSLELFARASPGSSGSSTQNVDPVAGSLSKPMRAAVRLDDLPRDREAETGAGDARCAGITAEELREDPFLLVLGNAEAFVADDHAHARAAALGCELDRASLRAST